MHRKVRKKEGEGGIKDASNTQNVLNIMPGSRGYRETKMW